MSNAATILDVLIGNLQSTRAAMTEETQQSRRSATAAA